MNLKNVLTIGFGGVVVAVIGAHALAAQDKYTVKVPGGLAFSEFKGYEAWQVVSISEDGGMLAVIVANPMMIDAYHAGVPGNGKPFPDGSKIAKIQWKAKKSADAPYAVLVPDTMKDVLLIVGQQEVPGHRRMGIRPVQL